MIRPFLVWAVLAGVLGMAPRAAAQVAAADSAAVILATALRLDAEGQRDAAQALLRFVMRHYAATPAAADAALRLGEVQRRATVASGRGELMVWSTLYGAWLGVAVPAALGADSPEPYGIGLLVGAPVGFLASRGFARRSAVTAGQARVIAFGSQWGTWQGFGWRAVLDLGNRTETLCFGPNGSPPCDTFESESDRAPWVAAVAGGLGGMAMAALVARGRDIPSGRATFGIHGAYWGTWYGLAGAILTEPHTDDQTLTWVLLGGNLGLLAAAIGGPDGISSGRTWLVTAGGVAGLAAGFGLDLLLQPANDQAAIAIPMATSALGLIAGMHWTRNFDTGLSNASGSGPGTAVLNVRQGRPSVGLPAVVPTVVRTDPANPRRRALAWRIPLFDWRL
jgi:hypothetical protein